ncbi:MAG: dTDP-4-dehydrorhamnose reductase [Chitinispirillaceae bacterium]|nr:dTDP-4-dehydrorhamnose reductase [Chitinispirillaceae bacterium]
MKRILIIGCNGQLGKDMFIESKKNGYEVEGIDYPEIDITKKESVEKVISKVKPVYVINCAAYTAVDDCEDNKELAFAVNADGAGFIASSSAAVGAKIIHISTDYVFDGKKKEPYIETDTPNPQSVYGKSKLAGELKVIEANKNHQIFRIAWLYGKYGKNFVYTIRNIAKVKSDKREPLLVVNDQIGTPTSTKEVCYQILKVLPTTLTGIFHATCEGYCSWYEFAKEIVEAAGIKVNLIPCTTAEFPRKALRPANSVLENKRLKENAISVMKHWKEAFFDFLKEEECSK